MATIKPQDSSLEAIEGLFENKSLQIKEEPTTSKNDTIIHEKTQESTIEKTEPIETPVEEETNEKTPKENHKKGRRKGTKNGEGEKIKSGIYAIMFDLEKELEDYFKETQWITRKSKKDYLNDLIRKDMIERVGAKKNCSKEELQAKWLEYKKKLQSIYEEL